MTHSLYGTLDQGYFSNARVITHSTARSLLFLFLAMREIILSHTYTGKETGQTKRALSMDGEASWDERINLQVAMKVTEAHELLPTRILCVVTLVSARTNKHTLDRVDRAA